MNLAAYNPQAIGNIVTVQDAKTAVTISVTAREYAKETQNHDLYIRAWEAYILASRRVTELIDAQINQGVEPELSFTPMQWSRRIKLLNVPEEKVIAYFDSVLAYEWDNVSVQGLYRYANPGGEVVKPFADRLITTLLSTARLLLGKLPPKRDAAIRALLKAFED